MRLLPRRLNPGEEATLVEHLGELRSRILVSLGAIVFFLIFTYIFRGHILHWLNAPLPRHLRKPVTFGVAEPFITSFMVAFFGSFLLSLPVVLSQVWGFFAPAFEEHTQRILVGFTIFASLLMAGGIAFGYWVALPAAVHFLTGFDTKHYTILIRARDYYSFCVTVLVAVGVVFELPVFLLALAKLGVLPSHKLRKHRRLGYVIMAAVAVALPGVDPVTTLVEMVPLMVLFEGSIWLAVLFEKRWDRQAELRRAAFDSYVG